MSSDMTTTGKFRVEDITFKRARKQSEILKEIEADSTDTSQDSNTLKAPVSITPEQVKSFLKQKITVSEDSNEKRVYSRCISWIDELLDIKKKYNTLLELSNSGAETNGKSDEEIIEE